MKRPARKNQYSNKPEQVRLNKLIAQSGQCSRREADALIEAGKVKVNGKTVTNLGSKFFTDAKISIDGKSITTERKVYIVMNKPKNVITTTDDPDGRKTVLDLLGPTVTERLYPVGRLDRNTTGVLLLTNDGDLAGRLTHPKYRILKRYEVKLNRGLKEDDLKRLMEGISLDDGPFKVDRMNYLDPHDLTGLSLEIHSGRNRIIRRSFEHLGYEVVKLDRVDFAGLTKKTLARGRWRRLSPKEVAWLKMRK